MTRLTRFWALLRRKWAEGWYAVRVRLFGRGATDAAIEAKSALEAVEADTADADAQVAQQRAAWVQNITYLTGLLDNPEASLPKHTRLDYERLVRQLRRNVRDLDEAEAKRHATPEGLGEHRLVSFGAVGQRRGLLGAVAGVQLWHALAVGWAVTFGLLGVQTARVASLKGHEREMRQDLREQANTIDLYQTREAEYNAALESAREQATETADALERERTRAARAAAAERRRQREIQNVLANSPEPPAWSLRNDGTAEPPTGSN